MLYGWEPLYVARVNSFPDSEPGQGLRVRGKDMQTRRDRMGLDLMQLLLVLYLMDWQRSLRTGNS